MGAADELTLLERHRPVVRYDAQETYFADSAAEWTDGPHQMLQRAAPGPPLAVPPALSLGFLGPRAYGDGSAVRADDRIGCAAKTYLADARALHADRRYGNRVHGHVARGSDGRLWLQYWLFYFYNDYNLLGKLFPAGLHEGDWEMVQLRLDAAGAAPDLAVYAQHRHAEARRWTAVERVGDRPVVYPARGSHASYFAPGTHWTGHWFDHADGRGFSPELTLVTLEDGAAAWATWPGYWGGTMPTADPLDATSPRGPGGHAQWGDPVALLMTAVDAAQFVLPPAPAPPPAPAVALARVDGGLTLSYRTDRWPAGSEPALLVVTVNAPEDPLPPVVRRIPIATAAGTVAIPDLAARDDWSYAADASVVDVRGVASASAHATVAAAVAPAG